MKENLEELNARGIKAPVLLGGAALTRDYAEDDLANLYGGNVLYCRDAFDGLHMMDAIVAAGLPKVIEEQKARVTKRKTLAANAVKPKSTESANVVEIAQNNPVTPPPFWGRRVVKDVPASAVFPYINTNALFLGQWGLKKGAMNDADYEKLLDEKAHPTFNALQRRAIAEGFIAPKIVYGYFPVQADGDDLIVYHTEEFTHPKCDCGIDHHKQIKPHGTVRERLRFTFPRQDGRRKLCISDFFRSKASGEYDVLGLQLVTVGDQSTELAEKLRHEGKYQDYLFLHGFGVESAEALAEMWHKRMRQELGFGSEDDPTMARIFQQKYRGSRYSFGYPACPNLEDREKIVELLNPSEIGVTLSENYMLVPEQSTDALIAHHPQAKYFDV